MRTQPTTVAQALLSKRFLLTSWPWRALAYLVTTPILVAFASVPLGFLAIPWLVAVHVSGQGNVPAIAIWFLIGAIMLAAGGPLVAAPLGWVERRRLALVDSRPLPKKAWRADPWQWLRNLYTDPATWRECAYAALFVTVIPLAYGSVWLLIGVEAILLFCPFLVGAGEGPIAFGLGQLTSAGQALPYALLGLILLPLVPYAWSVLAALHAIVARALLQGADTDQLRAELVEVSRSRARLVDAFEAERRRIERDLHDGAQQRLLGLTMQLGLAKLDTAPDSPAGKAVADAHDQAKELMQQLRELIRGIHPPVLTDRGLPAAVAELADRTAVPVSVDAALPGRLPAHLEGAAYFVISEALTNVVKHSGATRAEVFLRLNNNVVEIDIVDNGHGGADPRGGSGLTGLADRVAVADGKMYLSSPVGGPTLVRVEIPCLPAAQ
ncbi:sensor histidine kinase [Fodinicola feengrottensis]